MTARGKHSSRDSKGFYRDLAMMIAGIVLVGAAVFLLLFLLADGPDATPTADETTTTSEPAATTTSQVTTTSSSTSSTSTTTTIPVRAPSEIRVVVLNSIGVTGAAGRLTTRLGDAGYQTLDADDYEPTQDPSRIWYRISFASEAAELTPFVPGALVEALPDDSLVPAADIIVVLGTGYEE